MSISFYKLSHGSYYFSFSDVLEAISDRLVYVHRDTKAKGRSERSQAEDFCQAPTGAYFYLTHGNEGVYLLGQLTGPVNFLSKRGDGWMDRPYRPIKFATDEASYQGKQNWWAPNHNSTFIQVPEGDLAEFEAELLSPFFDLSLADFGI